MAKKLVENGTQEKKSDMVRRLVAAGDYKAALRIAKDFRLGITKEQQSDMVRGFECLNNARFYQSIGYDPAQIAQKGIETVISLYGT